MAGLVCAARLRELGHNVRVLEKGTRPGGSMLLSSCVVWRHLDWEDFRAECPDGDAALQRLIWERLDDALRWLVSLGAEPIWEDTENPRTTGKRFDPRKLTELLAVDVELGTALPADAEPPPLLAGGGFGEPLPGGGGASAGPGGGGGSCGRSRWSGSPRSPPTQSRRSSSRVAVSGTVSRRSAGCFCARTRGATALRATTRCRAAPPRRPAWSSSTA